MKRLLLYLAFIALVGAGAFIVPTVWLKPWTIDHFYARTFVRFALRHPVAAHAARHARRHAVRRSTTASPRRPLGRGAAQEARWAEHELATLRSFDRSRMGGDQRLSAEVLDWFMADQKEGNRFLFYDYPVNQLFGVQSTLPSFMIGTHPLVRPRDADHYIQRVSRFGVAMDQIDRGPEAAREDGRRAAALRPRQGAHGDARLHRHAAGPRTRCTRPFPESLPKIKGLDETKRKALLERLETQIRTTVDPAYTRLIERVRSSRVRRHHRRRGMEAARRRRVLRALPTQPHHHEPLGRHRSTRSACARSRASRRRCGRSSPSTGYATADLAAAAIHRLEQEPRFHYPDGDSGRALIMADYQAIIDDADRRVGALFDVRPKTGVKVERVPAFKEQTAPGAYYNVGIDQRLATRRVLRQPP